MMSRPTGAASMRHVGLVALEAFLVATIVWVATMALAGANQSDGGLTGTANAGRAGASLIVPDGRFGAPTIAHVRPAGTATWVHAQCVQSGAIVLTEWVGVGTADRVALTLGPTSTWAGGGAACTAEAGYFSANGRWRVTATTTFLVGG